MFRKELKSIAKKQPYCAADICDQLKDKTAKELDLLGTRVAGHGPYTIRKIRLANIHGNSGKSGGYRTIIALQKEPNELVFLYIYPKSETSNYSPNGLTLIVKAFVNERNEGKLIKVNLQHELIEISM